MNEERYSQIINEAYENYVKQNDDTVGRCDLWTLKKEEFINNCKIDSEFSEKWGLKIEERELSEEEKVRYFFKKFGEEDPLKILKGEIGKYNIPTKLITLTYNNEKIESYE